MRFYFSSDGSFLFQSDKILRHGNSPALSEALSLIYSGHSSSDVRNKLKEKFSSSDVEQVFLFLSQSNQIPRKPLLNNCHQINYTSYLSPDLGDELIDRLDLFFSEAVTETNIHFFFVSSWQKNFEMPSNETSLICPIVVHADEVQVGPLLDNFGALENFLNFIFPVTFLAKSKGEFRHPVSLDYFTERQLVTIVNLIGTEVINSFNLNKKKTILHGLKCLDLIENEIIFYQSKWNFHKTRTVKLVKDSYPPLLFRKEPNDEIIYTDGGYRTHGAEDTIDAITPFLESKLGILKNSREYLVFNKNSFSIFYASTIPIISEIESSPIQIEHQSYGKGKTRIQSKLSCYAELIERYQVGVMDPIEALQARYEDIKAKAFGPQELESYSSGQRKLSAMNPNVKHPIPSIEYQNESIFWVPSFCLVNQKTFWLPFSYCIRRGLRNETKKFEDPFCSLNSSGFASGASWAEAIIQGALELIERDHASIWWYNKLVMPEIVLESFENAYFSETLALLHSNKKKIRILDLTMDLGVYTVAAIIETSNGKISSVGIGAHIDIEIAVARAVTECLQIMEVPGLFGESLLRLNSLSDTDNNYLKNSTTLRTKNDYLSPKPTGVNEALQIIVEVFAKNNLNLLIQDYSLHELEGFFVIRSVSPGLSTLKEQLSNKRLFETPLKLGLITAAKQENELNQISFEI